MTDNSQNIKQKNPAWFRLLNLTFLLPCIVWPFVFFATIFFFDNPKSLLMTFLLFIAVNAYPLYLIGILWLNARLFKRNKLIASILPIAFGLTFILTAIQFVGGLENIKALWTQINSKQDFTTDQNQFCCGFTTESTNILYNDTIIENADISSFEIINFNWAKDKNTVYYNGRPVSNIDSKTFRYLDYHYAVDKSYVYYDDQIIEGADAATFKHINGTQDGKDKNNCYRYGEVVDCKTLLTDDE